MPAAFVKHSYNSLPGLVVVKEGIMVIDADVDGYEISVLN